MMDHNAMSSIALNKVVPDYRGVGAPHAIHPLVRTHPENGTKALYFHPTKTERILGMEREESRAFIDDLLDRIIRPEIVYRHKWRIGDMVVFDNRAALHLAHADYDPEEGRLLHRAIVKGDRPV
jgi:taurine dioxygenase